jgi:hypothetical protein
MKKILYYHIFLNDYSTWGHIFMEQFKLLEDVGLLHQFETVKVTAIADDEDKLRSFMQLISTFRKVELDVFMNSPDAENVMSRKMWQDSQEEDFYMLYLHSKGITSVENHLKNGDPQVFKNYYYWRHFLNWGVVEKWKDCVVELLTGHDLAGVNYFNEPAPHFSGNFWWAKSSYIRTLPDPSTIEWWYELQKNTKDPWLRTAHKRFRDENWVCSNPEAKISSMKNLDKVTNLSVELIPREAYT